MELSHPLGKLSLNEDHSEWSQREPIYLHSYRNRTLAIPLPVFSKDPITLFEVREVLHQNLNTWGHSLFLKYAVDDATGIQKETHLILKTEPRLPYAELEETKLPIYKFCAISKIGAQCRNLLHVMDVSEQLFTKDILVDIASLAPDLENNPLFTELLPKFPIYCIKIETEVHHRTLQDWILSQANFDPNSPGSFKVYQKQIVIIEGMIYALRFLHEKVGIVHDNVCCANLIFTLDHSDEFALPVRVSLRETKGEEYHTLESQMLRPTTADDVYSAGIVMQKVLQLLPSRIQSIPKSYLRPLPTYFPVVDHPVVSNAKELIGRMTTEDIHSRIKDLRETNLIFGSIDGTTLASPAVTKTLSLLSQPSLNDDWFRGLEFVRYIGSGAFGVVEQVYDKKLQLETAVKFLFSQEMASSVGSGGNWDRNNGSGEGSAEFSNAANLSHENIVLHYQRQEIQVERSYLPPNLKSKIAIPGTVDFSCIEMELCSASLNDWNALSFKDRKLTVPDLPMFEFLVVQGLFRGLRYLHSKNVLHRDIKPGNIFFSKNSTSTYALPVKIGDFGLSKILPTFVGTNLNARPVDFGFTSNIGTPTYMAPEIYGGGKYGKQADIYSLGLTIMETLQPKPEEFLQKHDWFDALVRLQRMNVVLGHSLISNVKELIIGMTQKEPSARYQSMKAIDPCCGGKDTTLQPKDSTELEFMLESCDKGTVIQLIGETYVGNFTIAKHRVTIKGMPDGGTTIMSTPDKPDTTFRISAEKCRLVDLALIAMPESPSCLQLDGSGHVLENVSTFRGKTGLSMVPGKSHSQIQNLVVDDAETGVTIGGDNHKLQHIRISNCETAIYILNSASQVSLKDVHISDCVSAIRTDGSDVAFNDVLIEHVGKQAITIGSSLTLAAGRTSLENANVRSTPKRTGSLEDKRKHFSVRMFMSELVQVKNCKFPSLTVFGCKLVAENVDCGECLQIEEGGGRSVLLRKCKAKVLKLDEGDTDVKLEECKFGKVDVAKGDGAIFGINDDVYITS